MSKTQTDYADDSVVKFDSVLDVANKTLNKDTNSKTSNIANYSKDTNLQNSSKENTVDTNTIDISSNDYKQQDNISARSHSGLGHNNSLCTVFLCDRIRTLFHG